jgi:hypothetical protein
MARTRFRVSWAGPSPRRTRPKPGSKAGEDCPSKTASKANRFLVAQAREIIAGKDTVYFKRHYKDGSTRPVRLRVNDFVAQHLARHKGVASMPAPARGVATGQPALQHA